MDRFQSVTDQEHFSVGTLIKLSLVTLTMTDFHIALAKVLPDGAHVRLSNMCDNCAISVFDNRGTAHEKRRRRMKNDCE
jgi:hypothetical protein